LLSIKLNLTGEMATQARIKAFMGRGTKCFFCEENGEEKTENKSKFQTS
jgi:hypothetical protein